MNTKSPHGTGKGKLTAHRAFVLDLHDAGATVGQIRAELLAKGVDVTHQSVWAFVKKQVERRLAALESNPVHHAAQILAAAAAQFGGGQLPQLAQVAPATAATKTPPRAATQTAAASPAVVAPVAAADLQPPRLTLPGKPEPWNPNRPKIQISSMTAEDIEQAKQKREREKVQIPGENA